MNFLDRFSKNIQVSNLIKSVLWKPSCSTRTDGRTDRHDEANSRFRSFANSPKN